jgi:hypothetical protein
LDIRHEGRGEADGVRPPLDAKEDPLKLPKILLSLLALGALMLIAAPAAQAKPSPKDARAAAGKARAALDASVEAARSGDVAGAIERVNAAGRLQAKAARLARRAGKGRKLATKASLLSGAAAGVDDAFDDYSGLIALVPPELQPVLLAQLEKLEAMRAELVAELTGFMDALPADVQAKILAAIAAFQTDGDLDALIAALTDDDVVASVQVGLQDLIAKLTTTLNDQLADLGGLEQLLPPGSLDQLDAIMAMLQQQLEDILGQLTGILTPPPGGSPIGTLPPIGLPGDLCTQFEDLLKSFGFPLPPGMCPS